MAGFGGGFGGGFGSGFAPAPAGFGAPPAPPAAGGFGSPSAPSGFGGTPAPPAASGFGGAAGGFGAAPAAAGGFGAAAPGGFGGGFGSPAPGGFGTPGFGAVAAAPTGIGAAPAAGGFGASPPAPAAGFGGSGGFGAASPSGFGAPPAAAGFGAPPASGGGFGATPAPSGFGTGFGAAPAAAGFNNSTSSFGSAPVPAATGFGSGATPFGAAAAPPASGASFSNSASSFGSGGATAFGAAATTSFAQPSFPQQQQQQQGQASGFGGSTGGFGSGSVSSFGGGSTGFGSKPPPQQSFGGSQSNPFGGVAAAPAAGMAFGSSAGVVQTNDMSMGEGNTNTSSFSGGGGFGANNASSGFGGPSFGSSAPQSGFGGSAQQPTFGGATPFGQAKSGDDDTMGDGGNNNNTMMGSHRRAQSPLPEASMSPTPDSSTPFGGGGNNKKDDELGRLKAKLAAKKKKLEEAKIRKKTALTPDNSPPPSPKRSNSPKPSGNAKPAPGSLAERNALRFAPKAAPTRSLLPTDLKTTTASVIKDYDAEAETLDLQNAKSLVGLCKYMCPDDELKRRENESDIQLLETIHSDVHPADWNLRNTAVKRFRRSAADYKLDVPEWIRPADVLERVCGYLEEWVMERDRQGPDPRYPGGITPAPLDVYQFIWDRTRMVRKDFILQNYVGTGGKCDARAVRCHERIARWHTMCEHQLSHIPDFARMQSQQNIAELGQAMKTLNLFYDDSMRRSTVDVPDANGRETRTQIEKNAHGCESNIINGVPPVDFDGNVLRNDESTVGNRLIGVGATSPARGTAEPEMRALYILLTLENDGGMEVLKYAAKLSQERPDIFNSKPVQLALEIFKAKQQMNYARFFSILRSPSTPYLFACLMFKHVEEMRKTAIRVMYSTYGYKRKDVAAIQDQYPLKTLGRLLCFEDMGEARTTCQHYNITVKEVEMSSSSSPTGKKRIELIFWKGSKFKIPMDEDKGVVIPIRPRKMIRTIESKLKGITRLAVCRGEASGEGSALSSVPTFAGVVTVQATLVGQTPEQIEMMRVQKEKQQAAALKHQQELFAKQKEEDERRQKMELKRKMEAKKRQAELARQKAEEEKAKEIERKKQIEIEMARKKAEELEQRRREEEEKQKAAEEARRKAEAEAKEKKRLAAEAAAERKAEAEAAKRKAEEEERERQRQEVLRKEREERERQQKLRDEAAAKKRREEELKRQQKIAEEMEQQRQEKLRKAAEEAKRKAEEEEKVNRAKKLLLWRRLRANLAPALQKKKTEQSLKRIDPTFCVEMPSLLVDAREQEEPVFSGRNDADELPLTEFLDALIQEESEVGLERDLRKLASEIPAFDQVAGYKENGTIGSSVTLIKLAILVPEFEGVQAETVYDLVHKWINSRLIYDEVQCVQSHEAEIRFVVVNGNQAERAVGSDVALLVIPPFMNDTKFTKTDISSILACIDESVRVFALNMDDSSDPEYAAFVQESLSVACAESIVDIPGDDANDFDNALGLICSQIVQALPRTSTSIDVSSLSRLCADAVRCAVYHEGGRGKVSPDMLLERARNALISLANELGSLYVNFESSQWATWPPSEFTHNFAVEKYFGSQGDLQISWFQSLQATQIDPAVSRVSCSLEGTFHDVIAALLSSSSSSPDNTASQCECEALLIERQYEQCLDIAVSVYCKARSFTDDDTLLYIPRGMTEDIIASVSAQMPTDDTKDTFSSISSPLATDIKPFSSSQEPDESNTVDDEKGENNRSSTPQLLSYDEPPARKRSHDEGDQEQPTKRHRESAQAKASKAFTAKLEAMLKGDVVFDMKVGDSTLSGYLMGVPAIRMPGNRDL